MTEPWLKTELHSTAQLEGYRKCEMFFICICSIPLRTSENSFFVELGNYL